MPKKHKSQRLSKHRDDRDRSDSDSDARVREKERSGRDAAAAAAARVSRDSSSGEKRKLAASQSRDGKDSSCHGNGDASEEHGSTRRRRERAEDADRWNGGGDERGDGVVVDKDGKVESLRRSDSEKGLKSKGSVDSKSKPSRRHEEKREELVSEKEDGKSARADSKRKPEKDSGRKESQQNRESREKDHGSEKDRKGQDAKRESETRGGDGEMKRRQGSQLADSGEERQGKRVKRTDSPVQDESRNPELDRELEKRIRRRTDGPSERDKYQDDLRDGDERRLSLRGESTKNAKYKDERQKDGSDRDKYREDVDRDKYREDVDRDHRYRDGRPREDVDRDKRHRDDKYRDDRESRDLASDKYDGKHTRDETNASESRQKKLRSQNTNHDRDDTPVYDDRRSRYKDDKERRRYDDKDDRSDLRSQSTKEQRYDSEKKSSAGKLDSDSDRGRTYSRHVDLDYASGHGRHRRSPSSGSRAARDQYRSSKQTETKYRHPGSEERGWSNAVSTRDVSSVSGVLENAAMSRSMEKSLQKDDNYLGELSAERLPNSDARFSPLQLVDKSSASSNDRRYTNRAPVRRSIDIEDSGQRNGGSKDMRSYSGNEGIGVRDLHLQTHSGDEFFQVDTENMSLSSPFGRNNTTNASKSLLPPPPPSRVGVDSPSPFGSLEDDNRGKLSNREKRIGDSNSRGWKGAPGWPSPVGNGFVPFQHGPPPVGFHPIMQQFPGPSMFGIRQSRELNHSRIPFHLPDSERFPGLARPFGWRNPDDLCPPPLHAWDASNGIVGNESHIYGRSDWDPNRAMVSSRGWDTSVDMWKQNNGVALELPAVPQKEDYSAPQPADLLSTQSDQRVSERNDSNLQADSVEINQTINVAKESSDVSEDLNQKMQDISMITEDDGARLSCFYLSKLDISVDLAYPELYNQCANLMDLTQEKTPDEDVSQPIDAEIGTEERVNETKNLSTVTLFPIINDSIFQRAMSLYKKHKEEMRSIYPALSNIEKAAFQDAETVEHDPLPSQVKKLAIDSAEQQEEVVPTSDFEVAERLDSVLKEFKLEDSEPLEDLEVPLVADEISEPNLPNIAAEPIISVKMEVEPVLHQVTSTDVMEETVSPSPTIQVKKDVETFSHQTTSDNAVEDHAPTEDDSRSNTKEHKVLADTMCGSLHFPNVSSEKCEAEMSESIDSGLVNLIRIHQSQSTH